MPRIAAREPVHIAREPRRHRTGVGYYRRERMLMVAAGHVLLIDGAVDDQQPGCPMLTRVADALHASGLRWQVRRVGGNIAADVPLEAAALRGEFDAVADRDLACLLVVITGAVVRDGRGLQFEFTRDASAGLDPADVSARPAAVRVDWPLTALAAGLLAIRVRPRIAVLALDADPSITATDVIDALAADRETAIIAVVHRPRDVVTTLVAALRDAALRGRPEVLTTAWLAGQVATSHAAAVRLPAGPQRDHPWFPGAGASPVDAETPQPLLQAPSASIPSSEALGDPLVGSILPGRFRIDGVIAAGGFGTVYRARQLTVDRDVAVKVIRAGVEPFSDDGRLFVHEIQAVARIDHRNVVRVFQADTTDDGRLFFAMELLEGRDLQLGLAPGALPPARAVALIRQLLDALDAAHQAGIVHADVKPGNAIVVGDDERLVLVDFGLARLRRLDAYATSVGGTPAFMAPEQLRAGQVDARSDQFSAALVLVKLLTGWHRRRAHDLTPPDDVLATIADSPVRAAVARALAIEPDDRFPTAAAFAAALSGNLPAPPSRPPFHGLAAFGEEDRGRLHGRDRELARITELALFRRITVVTAPSGVGKTSLLRAGLVPRLAALSTAAHYASCRSDDEAAVAAVIAPGTTTLAEALVDRDASSSVVLVLDQVEATLDGDRVTADPSGNDEVGTPRRPERSSSLLDAVVAAAQARDGAARAVLCVREDFLARLLDRLPERGVGVPSARVGPLDADGARAAITRPLAERCLAIELSLLDQLLADLVAAGRQLGSELGWSELTPVYPPHLQLVCSVLHDRLAPERAALSLADYRALGGFGAIVGEHLERVLDELEPADEAIARDVFLALVGATQLRTARSDVELTDAVGEDRQPRLARVLEVLQQQGLIARARRPGSDRVWELIHDSLVPRVAAWIDRRDLSRRRAIELVRYHLRRTRPDAPSLLSRPELRELDDHADAISALDADWRRSHALDARESRWTPATLVARSRQVSRRSTLAAIGLGVAVIAGLSAAIIERWRADGERQAEAARRDADLGLSSFVLTAFDWDAAHRMAVPVPLSALPGLSWTLHAPSFDDPDDPGEPMAQERFQRFAHTTSPDGLVRVDPIEAPGGAAFLVISGRGRAGKSCAASVIPLRGLPGYARRGAGSQSFDIHVPTCQATVADTIEIPAGEFIFGGLGVPPSEYQAKEHPARATEHRMTLPAYRIDRTEVTNAAYAMFSGMRSATGIAHPKSIPTEGLEHAADPGRPASTMTWREARAYCKFLGKHLVSSAEWEKAMRGGLTIDGHPNPSPRRNFPWGTEVRSHLANFKGEAPPGVQPAGTFAGDRSPYGVVDLAGNVSEWVGSALTGEDSRTFFSSETYRVIRGGNWDDTPLEKILNYVPIENTRPGDSRFFTLGLRCAVAISE